MVQRQTEHHLRAQGRPPEHCRSKGRGLRLLTSGLKLDYELPSTEQPLAIWVNNPFVSEIVDANRYDAAIMKWARKEKDNFPQFEHVIRGIGAA